MEQLELIEFEEDVQAEEAAHEDLSEETAGMLRLARSEFLEAYRDAALVGDFSVSFSGGKDSTLTLKIVFEALETLPPEQRGRRIHIACADTMVETPLVHEHIARQLDQIREYIESSGMPAAVHHLKREMTKESYFVGVLGLGYSLPDNKNRYCTHKLKLSPQRKYFEKVKPSVVITGVRRSESGRRMAAYTSKWSEQNASYSQALLYMPILDFTVDHVWEALKAPVPWGSTIYVRNIYKDATGECGFVNPKGTEKPKVDACGARFGCWVCPVVKSDKSTEQMALHHAWLEPLTRWRKLHMVVAGQYEPPTDASKTRFHRSKELRMWEEISKVTRYLSKAGHDRNGRPQFDPQGRRRWDWGTLVVEARKYLLEELLQTQEEVNELRADENLPPIVLIADEEVNYIRNLIAQDEKERPWLVSGIKHFAATIGRKQAQIEAKHRKHWDDRPMRCPECCKRMKIVRHGTQKCLNCSTKARQMSIELTG